MHIMPSDVLELSDGAKLAYRVYGEEQKGIPLVLVR